MTPTAVLEARGLTVTFGGVRALDEVSFAVGEGTLTGLIGPNGAGKTTTIDALTGFVRHRGRVVLDQVDLSDARPHERAAAGLTRTWQSLELFDDLTVRENCLVATGPPDGTRRLRDVLRPAAAEGEEVDEVLELTGLAAVADRHPAELSLGHRKLVGVARALAARPRVLLLDEPAAGLSTDESLRLGRQLRAIVETGTTVLLVDHDMGLVLGESDEVVVLDFGSVIAVDDPESIRTDERVLAAYLGGASVESPGGPA